jgi:hypothetical protein
MFILRPWTILFSFKLYKLSDIRHFKPVLDLTVFAHLKKHLFMASKALECIQWMARIEKDIL